MSHKPLSDQTVGLAYCSDMVSAADEDLALSLNYVAEPDRPRVAALYALAVELRRIPHAVSEPPLGEIRFQWWRDALAEVAAGAPIRAHPVVGLLAASGAVSRRLCDQIEAATDARAQLLYGEGFKSPASLAAYMTNAEGWLAEAVAPDLPGACEGGAAYGLSRWGARMAPALDAELAAIINEKRAALFAGRVVAEKLAPALYLTLTDGYRRRASGAPWPVAKRLALFRAMAAGRL